VTAVHTSPAGAGNLPSHTDSYGVGPHASNSRPGQIDDADTGLPIRLLHDRVLVRLVGGEGERRSAAGIVIPATASVGHRLSWATAVGVGPHVRSIVAGDRVLFDPDDRSEVELHGRAYILLRERDVHAVAAHRVEPDSTGLYL
jgi:chaperonin GroES